MEFTVVRTSGKKVVHPKVSQEIVWDKPVLLKEFVAKHAGSIFHSLETLQNNTQISPEQYFYNLICAYKSASERGGNPFREVEGGFQQGRLYGKIEINSLEELTQFCDEIGGEIIIGGNCLEIYDDYRE